MMFVVDAFGCEIQNFCECKKSERNEVAINFD